MKKKKLKFLNKRYKLTVLTTPSLPGKMQLSHKMPEMLLITSKIKEGGYMCSMI